MKNFNDPDAFDESLKITEGAVEAQVNEPPAIIWLQWYDNPEVTWERDNIHEDDVKYGLYSEIERLRERAEELNKTIEFLDPPYGILELQDQLDAANALVEELENHLKKAIHDMGGIITHEQIAEAWAYRCSALEKSQHDENGDYWMEFVDGLINKIGIFRCEGCSACDPLVLKSPVCNGKGYVIKEVGDAECEHV